MQKMSMPVWHMTAAISVSDGTPLIIKHQIYAYLPYVAK